MEVHNASAHGKHLETHHISLSNLSMHQECLVAAAEIHLSSNALKTQMGPGVPLNVADVQICKDADGNDWLLGQGAYGKVGGESHSKPHQISSLLLAQNSSCCRFTKAGEMGFRTLQ